MTSNTLQGRAVLSSSGLTIEDVLQHLDGRGLTITDDELTADALHDLGLAPFDQIGRPIVGGSR